MSIFSCPRFAILCVIFFVGHGLREPVIDQDTQLGEMLCNALQAGEPFPDWLQKDPALGTSQVNSLCTDPLVPLNAGTKGGCELFKTTDKNMIIKRMHSYEAATLQSMRFFSVNESSGKSLIAPFYAHFELFGLHWGIMPNILLATKEKALYDLKGVTNPKYFKKTAPFRDPNWIADFKHTCENHACISVGVPVKEYLETLEGLAADVDKLAGFGAVDYSLLAAIHDVSAVGQRSALGRNVWPMYDFKSNSAKSILLGGVIDYLEYVWTERRAKPESDFNRAFYLDAKGYSCRQFFFIATQMLTPCKDVGLGKGCVHSFKPVLSEIFGEFANDPVDDNFLVIGCKLFPQHYMNVRSVVPAITAFVQKSLA